MIQINKYRQRFLLQILSLLFITSCEQGDSPADIHTMNAPRIASVSLPEKNTISRSIINGTESVPTDGISPNADKLSSIGVYAVCTDGTEYKPDHGSNRAIYRKEGNDWLNPSREDATNLFLPSTQTVNVYAYHPFSLSTGYAAGNFFAYNIEIRSTDDFNATQQADYLYAAGCRKDETVVAAINSTDNPGLHFNMQHAMAKLVFTVKKDATNTETLKLKEFKMKTSDSKGFRAGEGSNRRMNLETGAFSNLLPSSTLTFTAGTPVEVTTGGATVTALVAPVNALQLISFELTMEVGGKDTRVYRTKPLSNATTWSQGKMYHYSLKIEKMSAEVVGDKEVEVFDWTTETDEIPIQ